MAPFGRRAPLVSSLASYLCVLDPLPEVDAGEEGTALPNTR